MEGVATVDASAVEASSSALETTLEDMVVMKESVEDGIALDLLTAVNKVEMPSPDLVALFVSETGAPLFKVTTAGVVPVAGAVVVDAASAVAGFPSTSFINAR